VGPDLQDGPGLPRTVLDVGAHVGRFLHLARQAGWQAEGVELNPPTAAYAAARTGLPIHRVRAQDLAAHGRRFAAVVLTDVLEHIPRPTPVVTTLRDLLHPGGVLAIKVPHGPMQRLKEECRRTVLRRPGPGVLTRYCHVNHFTVAALRRCLETAGFGRITIGVGAPDFLPPGPYRTRGQAGSAWLRRAVYAAARLMPGGVHTPLGLHLQAFAINGE
jgi:SAM-dependent methyltransferase